MYEGQEGGTRIEVKRGRKDEGEKKNRGESWKGEKMKKETEGSSLGWAWPVLHNTDIH